MMPYVQGDPYSVPSQYRTGYESILEQVCIRRGDIGFLTVDESEALSGKPHRGSRSKFGRALHTEAGKLPGVYAWGGCTWGGSPNVILERNTRILLANSVDRSCAVWDAEHEDTSEDGDIGDHASLYPYADAVLMKRGEVHEIGILTPHESLPVTRNINRQFLRIVGAGVHGREHYFTENPLVHNAA